MSEATVTKASESRPISPGGAALRIEVIEGPDRGTSFVISPTSPLRVLLGSGPLCDIRLTDPTVSRRQISLQLVDGRCRIIDLESTNGTSVDGVALLDGFISGGEVIRCGDTALRAEPAVMTESSSLTSRMRFGHVIGASQVMRRLYPLCERLAASRIPVMIEGETGTGKEVLAESIHQESGLTGEFVVFDCTAVAATLIEAELFGHERGAFTGATSSRAGLLEQANGGTLFIDEIGDLELSLQPKLLRAVERGEYRRVGATRSVRSTVRFICATRRDLDREVAEGRFRDDLFHRLAVGRIELPPLRERKGDIGLLARAFLEQLGAPPETLSRPALDALAAYRWPGNVRELRNAIARRVELGDFPPAAVAAANAPVAPPPPNGFMDAWIAELVEGRVPFSIARRRAIDYFERSYVARILAEHGGNVSRASAASGIARRYFQLMKARTVATE